METKRVSWSVFMLFLLIGLCSSRGFYVLFFSFLTILYFKKMENYYSRDLNIEDSCVHLVNLWTIKMFHFFQIWLSALRSVLLTWMTLYVRSLTRMYVQVPTCLIVQTLELSFACSFCTTLYCMYYCLCLICYTATAVDICYWSVLLLLLVT